MNKLELILKDKPVWIDAGLLILRLAIGISFILHGYPKLLGGPEKWAGLGQAGPGSLGIHFWYPFWGFMAAVAEGFGGLALVLGVGTRVFLPLMFLTMVFATGFHLTSGQGSPSGAIEYAVIFIGLSLTGPGRYRVSFPFGKLKK